MAWSMRILASAQGEDECHPNVGESGVTRLSPDAELSKQSARDLERMQ